MQKRGWYIGLESLTFILKPIHTSLISLLIIRFFEVELWGQFVSFLLGVELLSSLLNWGQKPYLLRKFSLKPNEIHINWSKAVVARLPILILSIVAIAFVPAIQSYFLPLLFWVIFRWFSFLFDAIIQYNRNYGWAIIAEIIAIVVAISCIFIFRERMTLLYLIYAFACSSFARFLVLLPLLTAWKFSDVSFSSFKTELVQSFPFFALSLAGLLQTKGELYVATYLLQEQELASYQIMISFLLLGQTFAAIILGPFQKNIYRWQGENTKKLKRLYLQIGFLLSILFSISLFIILKFIYLIDISTWYIPLLFAYLFPLYFYFIESQLLLKHKKEKLLLYYNLVAAIFNIVIALFLINLLGIVGALISGIICRLILAKLIVVKSKSIQRIK